MIHLQPASGRRVHIQFKKALLFVGARDGRMGPVPSGPSRPDAPPPEPMIIDQITGNLRSETVASEGQSPQTQMVLTYPNPIVEGEYIDMFIDPENVACMWTVRSIIAVTPEERSQIA
jgi:hypothetical protein